MARRTGVAVPRTGTVSEFDEARGLGTVLGDDGRRYPFHCTAVVDGSRRVPAGARVLFVVVPGHGGRFEAASVTPLAGP